jgi:hypothetical protein
MKDRVISAAARLALILGGFEGAATEMVKAALPHLPKAFEVAKGLLGVFSSLSPQEREAVASEARKRLPAAAARSALQKQQPDREHREQEGAPPASNPQR